MLNYLAPFILRRYNKVKILLRLSDFYDDFFEPFGGKVGRNNEHIRVRIVCVS